MNTARMITFKADCTIHEIGTARNKNKRNKMEIFGFSEILKVTREPKVHLKMACLMSCCVMDILYYLGINV